MQCSSSGLFGFTNYATGKIFSDFGLELSGELRKKFASREVGEAVEAETLSTKLMQPTTVR